MCVRMGGCVAAAVPSAGATGRQLSSVSTVPGAQVQTARMTVAEVENAKQEAAFLNKLNHSNIVRQV
jgi:hypothetical protein